MISWFRRGRHHVGRGKPRGYDVVERISAEPRKTGETIGGWPVTIVDGKEYFVMDMKVSTPSWVEWTEQEGVTMVVEQPGTVMNFPVLVNHLRRDVPLDELTFDHYEWPMGECPDLADLPELPRAWIDGVERHRDIDLPN